MSTRALKKRYPGARFVAAELSSSAKVPSCHPVGTLLTDLNKENRYNDATCPICQEQLDNLAQDELVCRHRFHHECIGGWFGRGNYTCPMCRTVVSDEDLQAHDIVRVQAPVANPQNQDAAPINFPQGTILPHDFDELFDFDIIDRQASGDNDPYAGWPRIRDMNTG